MVCGIFKSPTHKTATKAFTKDSAIKKQNKTKPPFTYKLLTYKGRA